MTVTEIIALAHAGFSKEEISKIAAVQQPAQTMPVQQPAQTIPVKQPAQTMPVQTPPTDFNAWGQQFLAGLDSTLQKHNLTKAQQPPTETVDDILANIIAPPEKKKEVKIIG